MSTLEKIVQTSQPTQPYALTGGFIVQKDDGFIFKNKTFKSVDDIFKVYGIKEQPNKVSCFILGQPNNNNK